MDDYLQYKDELISTNENFHGPSNRWFLHKSIQQMQKRNSTFIGYIIEFICQCILLMQSRFIQQNRPVTHDDCNFSAFLVIESECICHGAIVGLLRRNVRTFAYLQDFKLKITQRQRESEEDLCLHSIYSRSSG